MIIKNLNKNKIKVILHINLTAATKILIMKELIKKHCHHRNGIHKSRTVTVKIQSVELKPSKIT